MIAMKFTMGIASAVLLRLRLRFDQLETRYSSKAARRDKPSGRNRWASVSKSPAPAPLCSGYE
jgi:hypothetical protein